MEYSVCSLCGSKLLPDSYALFEDEPVCNECTILLSPIIAECEEDSNDDN